MSLRPLSLIYALVLFCDRALLWQARGGCGAFRELTMIRSVSAMLLLVGALTVPASDGGRSKESAWWRM